MTRFRAWLVISAILLFSSPRLLLGQSTISNGLAAYYPFDGNANDVSGNLRHALANGTPLAPDRFGVPDRAYRFDGATNYLTMPHSELFSSEDFSLSLWFNAAVYPDMRVHFNEAESLVSKGRNYFELHLGCPPFADRGIRFLPRQDHGVSWIFDALSANFHTNRWYQIVATWQGTSHSAHLYLNGRELVVKDSSGPADTLDNALPARLGTRYNGPGADNPETPGNGGIPFQGMMDEVRIYDRVLSAAEVSELYAFEAPPELTVKRAVYLEAANLKPGTNYQLQVSSDLMAWRDHGAPFLSTNATWRSLEYWDVAGWEELYFRFQYAP